jgi:hypothetical protein
MIHLQPSQGGKSRWRLVDKEQVETLGQHAERDTHSVLDMDLDSYYLFVYFVSVSMVLGI